MKTKKLTSKKPRILQADTPVHLLSGMLNLSVTDLEKKLHSSREYGSFSYTSSWFFDLSKIQYAELRAVAQLCLIIAKYASIKQNKVFVALPTPSPSFLVIYEKNR